MKDIVVNLPTCNRDPSLTLFSLLSQSKRPDEVLVLDNGDIPITSYFTFRQVWDIYDNFGIPLKLIRKRRKIGVVEARLELLKNTTTTKYIFFTDDDMYFMQNYLESLYQILEKKDYNYATGLCLLANNEIRKPDFKADKVSFNEIKNLGDNQFSYFQYHKKQEIPLRYSNAICLIRSRFQKKLIKVFSKLYSSTPLEEFIMTRNVGNGVLLNNIIAWHLFNPSEKRDWRYSLENILREKFKNKPDEVKRLLTK